MTERVVTFIRWVDEKKRLCIASFPEITRPPEVYYDYTLFPCSHQLLNLSYMPVVLGGHMMCDKCKCIREIESIRIKRY